MKNIKSITDEKSKVKILLASKSPRRQELLKNINLDFDVAVSNFDEKSISAKDRQPGNYAGELALRKAETVADSIKAEKGVEYLVIGADTIVVLNGEVLGQPAGADDARRMLKLLSGTANQVITGVAVISLKDGQKTIHKAFESTLVYFKQLAESEIERYIATGEPLDKAGAYGIQGLASLFVEEIEGCYFNVVGLPIMRLSKLFKLHGYSLI
ncbi:MAG TPA: Maf family protein [Candidatus Wallbacteria bacterium]|nr:Maf family protein [Candidatus Wallbacteria bacterium]